MAIAILCCASPGSGSIQLTKKEQAFLDSHGPLIFISQTDYPPFEFRQNNNPAGMTIELVHWLAAELGFRIQFKNTSFLEAQKAVKTGNADILTSLFFSKKRDQIFDFSPYLFKVPAFIFIAAQRADIHNISDLKGKAIAIQAGDYARDFLESRHISYRLITVNNFSEATDAVLNGTADAIIGDEQVILYYLFSHGLRGQLKSVGEPLYTGLDCMAVKEGNTTLLSILSKGIATARSNGILEKLNKKWIGTQSVSPSENQITLWPYLTIAVVVLLIVLLWNFYLRSSIIGKTKALVKSEDRYRRIYENLVVGIFESTVDGTFLNVNNAFAQMLGYNSTKEVLENIKNISTQYYANPEDREKFRELLQKQGYLEDYEIKVRCKDGSFRWISNNTLAIKNSNGDIDHYEGVVIDITRRKRAEIKQQNLQNQLRQKLKTEAIGVLAGGIAHNLNNDLTVIMGNIELLKTGHSAETVSRLKNMESAAKHSQKLIQKLLKYGRQAPHSGQVVEFSLIVDKLARLVELLLPPGINLDLDIHDEVQDIYIIADSVRIQEAVTNLCDNAVLAMQGKGNLSISADITDLTEDEIPASSVCNPGRHARLGIKDTGCGINTEITDRIFDPFFSTRQKFESTGMGLAIVQGIIEQHGGLIKMNTVPGHGTVFYLYFPIIEIDMVDFLKE